jgi:hypothetical protein
VCRLTPTVGSNPTLSAIIINPRKTAVFTGVLRRATLFVVFEECALGPDYLS